MSDFLTKKQVLAIQDTEAQNAEYNTALVLKTRNAQLADLSKVVQSIVQQQTNETAASAAPQVVIKSTASPVAMQLANLADECTDCDGANPCAECAEHPEEKPQLKDGAYVNITLPNQGDPTAEQKSKAEADKRKKIMLYGGLTLAALIALIFIVKQLKPQ